jgi:hypothetical protein
MNAKRRVEIFSAGCPVCEDTIALINRLACASCEVTVLDMRNPDVASLAKRIGVRSVPAVVNWRSAVPGEVRTKRPSAPPGLGSQCPSGSGVGRCEVHMKLGHSNTLLQMSSKRMYVIVV